MTDRRMRSPVTRLVLVAAVLLVGALVIAVAALRPAPATSPWWTLGTPPITCAWPAVYRTPTVARGGLGGCAGVLVDPPAEVRLRVGQELDLHMTTGAPVESLPPVPDYALPISPDMSVLRLVSVADGGSTGVYRAVAAGRVVLTSAGFCIHRSGQETHGECPLLAVTVVAPSASAAPAPTAGRSGLVTGPIGPLTVTRPAAWQVVAGPPAVPGRPVPLAYLANVGLSVGTCPTITPDGVAGPCAPPVRTLPAGGVLVTIEPNMGLAEMIPPQVGTISPPDAWCSGIGGEAEEWSAVSGAFITACLRGPGLIASEAQFQAFIGSIRGELDFNRFQLARPAP